MKTLTESEIERIRMHGMTEPTDFARLAYTAKLAIRMREALEFYATAENYVGEVHRNGYLDSSEWTTEASAIVSDWGTTSREALKLWEQE